MKIILNITPTIFIYIFFSFLTQAQANTHDFSREAWAQGRSCLVCHAMKRTDYFRLSNRDITDLKLDEKAALHSHPMNIVCFACHVKNDSDSENSHKNNNKTPNKYPPATAPNNTEPAFTSGTSGSICVRVNSQGIMGKDCLRCHDIHNTESEHLLRPDYERDQPNP